MSISNPSIPKGPRIRDIRLTSFVTEDTLVQTKQLISLIEKKRGRMQCLIIGFYGWAFHPMCVVAIYWLKINARMTCCQQSTYGPETSLDPLTELHTMAMRRVCLCFIHWDLSRGLYVRLKAVRKDALHSTPPQKGNSSQDRLNILGRASRSALLHECPHFC